MPRRPFVPRKKKILPDREQGIEVDAIILETLPSTKFRVKLLEGEGTEILAHLSGKMRQHYIRPMPGDKVRLEMSPYDLTKGRIVFRYR